MWSAVQKLKDSISDVTILKNPKSDGFRGEDMEINSIQYSPDGKLGLIVNSFESEGGGLKTAQYLFRIVHMETGELYCYRAVDFEIRNKVLLNFYWCSNDDFCLIVYNLAKNKYQQYVIHVVHSGKWLIQLVKFQLTTNDEFDIRKIPPITGAGKAQFKNHRFTPIVVGDNILFWPFIPLIHQETEVLEGIPRRIDDYKIDKTPMTFGQHLYFRLYKKEFDGARVNEVFYYDRLLRVDLEIVMNSDGDGAEEAMQIVELKKLQNKEFRCKEKARVLQQGRYVAFSEEANTQDSQTDQSNQQVFVIDLEKMTTSIREQKRHGNTCVSVYQESLLNWTCQEVAVDNYGTRENAYGFFTTPLGRNVPSLRQIALDSFLLGKNGILPDYIRKRIIL